YFKQAAGKFDSVTVVVERGAASVAAGKLTVELLRHWGVEASSLGAAVVIKDALAAFMSLPDIGSRLGCPIAGMIPPAGEICLSARPAGTPLARMGRDSIARH